MSILLTLEKGWLWGIFKYFAAFTVAFDYVQRNTDRDPTCNHTAITAATDAELIARLRQIRVCYKCNAMCKIINNSVIYLKSSYSQSQCTRGFNLKPAFIT